MFIINKYYINKYKLIIKFIYNIINIIIIKILEFILLNFYKIQ